MTGAELRAIRKQLLGGMAAEAFARLMGMELTGQAARNRISRLENEHVPVPETIARLAEMYRRHGVPPEWRAG